MIRRSTWILLAIFIVGVGLVFYLDKHPISNANVTPTATLLPPIFSNVSADKLVMVEIQSSTGSNIELKRNPDNTWGFTNIPGKSPDQGKVQELLFTITGLTVTEGLNSPLSLDSFGLTNPSNTITLQDDSGNQNILHIGALTSISSGYYVQLNKNNPVIIDKGTIDNLISLFTESNLVMATPTSQNTGLLPPSATNSTVEPPASPTMTLTPAPAETTSTTIP
ncbi:MAG TPA: DUF4340 domain-containing protein [Anaerolineaceae bacterium]|nr:DUF4340 domain-containing protein [Anaerolineaceae bacterium]